MKKTERSKVGGRHRGFGVAPAKYDVTTRYPGGDAKEATGNTGVEFKIEDLITVWGPVASCVYGRR